MRRTPLICASLASAMALIVPGRADAADSIKCNLAWDAATTKPSRAGYKNFLNICGSHSRASDARAWIRHHTPTPTPTSTPTPTPTPTPRRPLTASEALARGHTIGNRAEAAPYFKQACDGGIAHGCRDLGIFYDTGKIIPVDKGLAAQLYAKACEGGETDVCNNAAAYYRNGEVVPIDKARAATLYEKACEGGDAEGCFVLGKLNYSGEGVAVVNKARAAKLFEKACDLRSANACSSLGISYEYGGENWGVTANRTSAIELYRKALRLEPSLQHAKDGLKRLGVTP